MIFLFEKNISKGKTMEKIPVASAMQWSIELEKGLRSKKPGKGFVNYHIFTK